MAEDSYLQELTEQEKQEYYESKLEPRESETQNELGVEPIDGESKSDSEGKNEPKQEKVGEKITEDQLPTKKGEKSTIAISENVDAVITIGKDLSGESTFKVSILKDGEVQEDKFGDTEVEFSMDEKAEVLKYIEDKKRGYSLAGKGKKGKADEVKPNIESGKNVTFEMFGETKSGVLQSDGSVIGSDGTRYTPSMVKNIRITKNNDDIQDDEVVAGQGLFSYSPNQRDIALSKEGIVYDKSEDFKKYLYIISVKLKHVINIDHSNIDPIGSTNSII
jgi:hypothetical protein